MQVPNIEAQKPENFLEYKLVAAWENIRPAEVGRRWGELPLDTRQQYLDMLGRLRAGYPLDYLLPSTRILGRDFRLREGVLIPRPETEELIALVQATQPKPPTLVDVGCGSGLIGISLSTEFERIIMLEVSAEALAIAKENVVCNAACNVETYRSNLLNNLPVIDGDWWLVANLPYVPEIDKQKQVEYRTEFEPDLAIYSGEDGLDLFRELTRQLSTLARRPAKLYFELDPRNIHAAQRFVVETLGLTGTIHSDAQEYARFLVV